MCNDHRSIIFLFPLEDECEQLLLISPTHTDTIKERYTETNCAGCVPSRTGTPQDRREYKSAAPIILAPMEPDQYDLLHEKNKSKYYNN